MEDIILPGKSTIQILTKESLWVSGKIAGTFHSRVSLVARGISHISTTLDPIWFGPLLITIRNNTEQEIFLKQDMKFVTLVFYKLITPIKFEQRKFNFVQGILLDQLNSQTQGYLESIRPILNDSFAHEEFVKKVKEANKPIIEKVLISINNLGRKKVLRVIWYFSLNGLILFLIVALSTLGIYWPRVKMIFNGVEYDTNITAIQLTLIGSILFFLTKRK